MERERLSVQWQVFESLKFAMLGGYTILKINIPFFCHEFSSELQEMGGDIRFHRHVFFTLPTRSQFRKSITTKCIIWNVQLIKMN